MKFVQLKTHIKNGVLLPCYAAFGDDPYLVRRAKEMFLGAFLDFSQFNVSEFDEGVGAEGVVSMAQTMPLMSDKRLIIAPISVLKDLGEYLKQPALSSVIFLHGQGKVSGAKMVEEIDCNRLDLGLLNSFVAIECAKRGCSINKDASTLLAQRCARFMGRIVSELDKLAAFKLGGVIECEDVRLCVSATLEYRVFELTDAILKKDTLKANAILEDMLSVSGAAAKVFGLLYSHFRRLMYAALNPDENIIMGAFSIKEFAARSAIVQAKAFSRKRLKYFLDKLHAADDMIKRGGGEKLVLNSFIYEVMSI